VTGRSPVNPIRPRSHGWWRVHQAIIRDWIQIAFRSAPSGPALKTDLFDEASGSYHHAFDLPAQLRFIGLDIDRAIAVSAFVRIGSEDPGLGCVVGDIRHPPFRHDSCSAVLSLSTLDHLASREEIRLALAGIYRLLLPGGILLLSLDNPANPEVALRARLPLSIVRRLRSDSFPLGQTLSRQEGSDLLTETGFAVQREFHMGHAIRYPTIRLIGALERRPIPALVRFAEKLTLSLEVLSNTPLASFTGHYSGWIAVKPDEVEKSG